MAPQRHGKRMSLNCLDFGVIERVCVQKQLVGMKETKIEVQVGLNFILNISKLTTTSTNCLVNGV